MALIKDIELENGIVVKYHRIVRVTNITNVESIIEVGSYISKTKRDQEKAAQQGENINIFIQPDYIPIPYEETLNVVSAYNYLKTTEKYGGSQDD